MGLDRAGEREEHAEEVPGAVVLEPRGLGELGDVLDGGPCDRGDVVVRRVPRPEAARYERDSGPRECGLDEAEDGHFSGAQVLVENESPSVFFGALVQRAGQGPLPDVAPLLGERVSILHHAHAHLPARLALKKALDEALAALNDRSVGDLFRAAPQVGVAWRRRGPRVGKSLGSLFVPHANPRGKVQKRTTGKRPSGSVFQPVKSR